MISARAGAKRNRLLPGVLVLALGVQGCAAAARIAAEEYVLVRSAVSGSTVSITLDEEFVERYRDRVTIDVPFTVDRADILPHPAFIDGDFHIAGRAPGIGLPIVAEIKNAASEKKTLAEVRKAAGTGRPIRLSGAWRLWSEHVGGREFVQGAEVSVIETTNPDHVFEIHPVTGVGDESLLGSLHPPKGYGPASAEVAFGNFEAVKCTIIPKGETITIMIPKGQINDAEFLMEIAEGGQRVVEDGRFVDAAVLDLKGKRILRKARMVFVKDSPPEKMVKALGRGSRLHVYGIPRFDLSEISKRAKEGRSDPKLLDLNLPYEIVILGVYGDGIPGVTTSARTGVRTIP